MPFRPGCATSAQLITRHPDCFDHVHVRGEPRSFEQMPIRRPDQLAGRVAHRCSDEQRVPPCVDQHARERMSQVIRGDGRDLHDLAAPGDLVAPSRSGGSSIGGIGETACGDPLPSPRGSTPPTTPVPRGYVAPMSSHPLRSPRPTHEHVPDVAVGSSETIAKARGTSWAAARCGEPRPGPVRADHRRRRSRPRPQRRARPRPDRAHRTLRPPRRANAWRGRRPHDAGPPTNRWT